MADIERDKPVILFFMLPYLSAGCKGVCGGRRRSWREEENAGCDFAICGIAFSLIN
jgi:hypothetical protein